MKLVLLPHADKFICQVTSVYVRCSLILFGVHKSIDYCIMFAYKFCKKSPPTFRSYVLFMHAANPIDPPGFHLLGKGLGGRVVEPKIEKYANLV